MCFLLNLAKLLKEFYYTIYRMPTDYCFSLFMKQRQQPEVFCKKAVFKIFAIFTG